VDDDEVSAFWALARVHARLNSAPSYFGPTTLEVVPPPAWSFGDSAEQSDELLALVLAGTKTATASALRDYEAEEEPLPETGALSILLDGAGHPQALIEVTDVSVVPFDDVDDQHARHEGEGDLSLGHWRDAHRRFFTATGPDDAAFDGAMDVVLERFRVVYRAS
jgi:uncharacterized protein YhfF